MVAIDSDIKQYTDKLVLDLSPEGNGLVLLGNESGCC